MKPLSYCLLLATILFTGCIKEKPAQNTYPTTHVKLNTAALEFVQIPLGRYFIYKDSATGSVDSVRVTESKVETIFSPEIPAGSCWLCFSKPAYYYDKYALHISSGSVEWLNATASCRTDYGGMSFAMAGHPPVLIESAFNLDNTFWYPFNSSGVNQYIFIPSLIIEGNLYNEVHQFFSTNGLQTTDPYYRASVFHWVKGIGIIKKEIRTPNSVKTSLLLRYGS